ncbi:MAG: hypothetical protein OEZ22_02810 [Spirochaetia bacterium]|nr:hypothetical protein [Spirochaetia bacterium]
MRIYSIYFPYKSAYLNLALEEYFLTQKEKNYNDIYLFFYENLNSIILGKTLDIKKEIYLTKKHPPVIRRISGGGSVVHFKGCLNFGFLCSLEKFPELFSIQKSYEAILGSIIEGFKKNFPLKFKGLSDLVLFQKGSLRKISGNSQARKKGWLLHHGTFLYNNKNISKISYFLKHPEKEPEYRKNRDHKSFMPIIIPINSKSYVIKNIQKGFQNTFNCSLSRLKLNESVSPDEIRNIQKNLMLNSRD